MKFHHSSTQFNCGIDLHARQMYVCVMDRDGRKLVHRNIRDNDFNHFLKLVAPYRHDLTVCCECMFGWYWLADACQDAGLTFVLAHALYLRCIHGGKNKNDRIDSEKLAQLLRANLIPPSYVYPAAQRPLRALLRQFALQNDLALIGHYDTQLKALETHLQQLTKQHAGRDYALVQTVPGIGVYLGLTILHEIGNITRFPSVKNFLSYGRLVKGTVASAGKIKGLRGAKLGNPYLRWAFGEAAVIAKRDHKVIGPLAQRLEARMNGNKFKANTVLAIKLARAVYYMLRQGTGFDADRLVCALSRN